MTKLNVIFFFVFVFHLAKAGPESYRYEKRSVFDIIPEGTQKRRNSSVVCYRDGNGKCNSILGNIFKLQVSSSLSDFNDRMKLLKLNDFSLINKIKTDIRLFSKEENTAIQNLDSKNKLKKDFKINFKKFLLI